MKLDTTDIIILKLLDENILFKTLKLIPRFYSIEWRSTNQYDKIDWLLKSENLLMEGKCRTGSHYSHLIEHNKYIELNKEKDFWYVSTNERGVFAWEKLNPYAWQDINWQYEWLPQTSKFTKTKMVKKYVGFLNEGYAINLTEDFLTVFKENLHSIYK